MSLPRQLHEQLLSAYLDDALSGDERERVDQMLARDAAVRAELQQMQRLRDETRQALAAAPAGASQRKLDDHFADRVMRAAFSEARRANLPSNHPLRRAADRAAACAVEPSCTAGVTSAWGRHRTAVGALLALAAALMLAVTLGRSPNGDQLPQSPVIAEAEGNDDPQPADRGAAPAEGLAVAEGAAGDVPVTSELDAAASVLDSAKPAPGAMIAAGGNDDHSAQRSAEPPAGSIASATTDLSPGKRSAMDAARDAAGPALADSQQLPLNMVMVLQVEQTELGRTNEVVHQLLRRVGIRTGVQRTIEQQVVGYLRDAKLVAPPSRDDQDRPLSILFIEAPGKQLDRFIVSLFQQPDQIAGIGLDLGIDPPLLAAASQLSHVDPSQVQHAADTATAWQLVLGEDGIHFPLPPEARPFSPVNAEMAGAGMLGGPAAIDGSSADSGPDIIGRLLMVIR